MKSIKHLKTVYLAGNGFLLFLKESLKALNIFVEVLINIFKMINKVFYTKRINKNLFQKLLTEILSS